jgi:hypothetical protein
MCGNRLEHTKQNINTEQTGTYLSGMGVAWTQERAEPEQANGEDRVEQKGIRGNKM